MNTATGWFRRIHGGLSFVAEVVDDVEQNAEDRGIECRCSGDGFTGQGGVEDVPATGYDDWKAGAHAGAAFSIAVIGRSKVLVTITRITG